MDGSSRISTRPAEQNGSDRNVAKMQFVRLSAQFPGTVTETVEGQPLYLLGLFDGLIDRPFTRTLHDITLLMRASGDAAAKLTRPATLLHIAREVAVVLNKETLARAACLARGFANWKFFPSLGRLQSAAERRTADTKTEILQPRAGEFPLLCLATSFFGKSTGPFRPTVSYLTDLFVCVKPEVEQSC